jgi:hypothetical protein
LAQDYKIQFVRPAKVGEQFTTAISAKKSETTQTLLNGEPDKKTTRSLTAQCQGTLKVLQIDDKTGVVTKIRYEVDRLTRDDDESYYPAGTVIIAKKDGSETAFEIDGERPDAEHTEVLSMLLDASSPNGISSRDDSTGTTARQKVGDSWPINAGKIASYYADGGTPVTADELKGQSTLASVKKLDGVDVMVIKSKITADGFSKDLDGGASLSDGKMTTEVTDVLPIDISLPVVSLSSKLTSTVTINPPLGSRKSVINTRIERRERREAMTP